MGTYVDKKNPVTAYILHAFFLALKWVYSAFILPRDAEHKF